jgi:hypothetical protein
VLIHTRKVSGDINCGWVWDLFSFFEIRTGFINDNSGAIINNYSIYLDMIVD